MSIYRIIDVTPAGAYMNAMNAMNARHDDNRRAATRKRPGMFRRAARAVAKLPGLLGRIRDRWSGHGAVRKAPAPAE